MHTRLKHVECYAQEQHEQQQAAVDLKDALVEAEDMVGPETLATLEEQLQLAEVRVKDAQVALQLTVS